MPLLAPQHDHLATARDYYRRPAVRARIREYCGGASGGPLTCASLSAMTPGETQPTWETAPHHPPAALDALLDAGSDVARSLLDRESLLVHLDLDHQNIDRPEEPFLHPADVFFKLEPVYRATRRVLWRFGIAPLVLMTGRGYHFTGRIPLSHPLVDRLAALIPEEPPWLATIDGRHPEGAPKLDARHARASGGLGLLIEHLAHLILRRAAPRTPIPVMVNGTPVGRGLAGRECISIDLSYVGDPLDARYLRAAFGTYQLHHLRADIFGAVVADETPLMAAIPRKAVSLFQLLMTTRFLDGAARLATHADARIPDVAAGAGALLVDYLGSPLAAFHRAFYGVRPHGAAAWPDTYDRLDLMTLPPCVAWPLRQPNDLLLQPARIQHVVRTLLADGWHPRHVAGLVHSRYARDFGWGSRWTRMDAASRADFDVRVFAGLIATGVDGQVDFNCVSAKEKGLCPHDPNCRHDLRDDRDRLLRQVMR
jgi:hypothetical protein